jgi:IMP dehydrogenase
MRFLHPERDEMLELSLDDVFLVPGYFDGGSRLDVDLRPTDFPGGSHPIVSANMNAVTGKRMAETMARFGGLGVLPQDMELETAARIIGHIKAADPRYDTPLSVSRRATLRDVLGIIRKRAHDMVVVVDDERRPVGIVTHADLRDRDQYSPVGSFMSSRMVTIPIGMPNRDAFLLMEEHRVKAAPVLDAEGRLVGVLTRDDAVRLDLLKPALDSQGKLMVAAAVGISAAAAASARSLAELGVSAIVLDTAHGHQRRMLEAIREVRRAVGSVMPLVAGNVCTPEGARDLIEAGADIVKVGVGPGAMCTTRMMTGVGRPQFSAVLECAAEARKFGKHVWADGGVRHPRDVAMALAAGASNVMIGSWFAGTYESPGDLQHTADGRPYKESFGMASARAVRNRTSEESAYDRARKGLFEEGISTSRMFLDPVRPGVEDLIDSIVAGVRSSCTYAGAGSLEEFHQRAVVGVQSAAGYAEGKPLHASWD